MFTSLKINLHGCSSFLLFLTISFSFANNIDLYAQSPKQIPLYYPYAEWEIEHSEYSGNPFDIIATVTFTHSNSGQNVTIEMFYDGDWNWQTEMKGSKDIFKFRFSGTQLGEWTYTTSSNEAALDGHSDTIEVTEQTDENLARGFVGSSDDNGQAGRKWIWSGSGKAFIPNIVMRGYTVQYYNNDPNKLENDITEFIDQHGFNGFLHQIAYSWFDPTTLSSNEINNVDSPNLSPSPESFNIIENSIISLYKAGAYTHLWEWGSGGSTGETSINGGVNSSVHKRLQRYIMARLGALPGWTLGFGWDLWTDLDENEINSWYSYYQTKNSYDHIIGARAHRNDTDPSSYNLTVSTDLDYKGHEDHSIINHNGNVAYDRWVEDWFNLYPNIPHFSEDRFRQNDYESGNSRDFTVNRTRNTLWQSAMAGGIATIWGQAPYPNDVESNVFTNKNMFKVFSDFWTDRFTVDLVRDNSLTDGYALTTTSKDRLIFYKEDTGSLDMDLTGVTIESAIAVDTRKAPYNEIDISSNLTSDNQNTWTAPDLSDWVIAINGESNTGNDPPSNPPSINEINTTETTATVSYSKTSDAESYDYRLDSGSPANIGTINPFEIEGLSAGTSYDLQMRSANSNGVSNWSEIITFTTQEEIQPPENPPSIEEINPGTTSAEVSYIEVNDADSYEYRLDSEAPTNIGTANPFTIEELIPDTPYDLQMRAINNEGVSSWSDITTFTTQKEIQPPENPPSIEEINPGTTSAEVSYIEVNDADSYEYRLDSETPTNIGTANPFTIEGLNSNTSYDLQMRALNNEGSSDWSGTTTFSTSSETYEIPDEVILEQNYPNPFNPYTTIRYGIPEAGHVLLEVYDLLGKKIETLVDEQQTSGFHNVTFNASNLSSGTYIYQLKDNNRIQTKKMLLVK